MSASKLSIYSGSTIAIGDYYSTTANGQAYVVKAANLAAAKSKGITPIAVIFSTTTSTIDQGHGWTNGYAMALQNAGNNKDEDDVDVYLYLWSTEAIDEPYLSNSNNNTFYDGYTETYNISKHGAIVGETHDKYPAFYAALSYATTNNVTTPISSSGWFLPSTGQAYKIIENICEMQFLTESGRGWMFGPEAATALINCNNYLKKAIGIAEKVDTFRFEKRHENYCTFWCSSEFSENKSYYWGLSGNSTSTYIFGDQIKNTNTNSVRAIIAF